MIRNKRKVSSSASNCRSAAVILRAVGPTAQRIKDFLPRRAVGFRLFACLRPRAARILNSSARLTFLLLQPMIIRPNAKLRLIIIAAYDWTK